ncbi:MAG: hypothetical protein V3T72_01235 [Thermoanaerobaculia bacterium]
MRRDPKHWTRLAIVAAGIVFGQLVLYGPSLIGKTVLLPVDLLAQPRWYLPQTPETAAIVPHSIVLSDPVLAIEPHRRFAASEIRAGRLPLWNPYNYTGSPMARWAPFSPYNLLYTLLPEPIGLAWIQLLKSLIAGLGAYLFFRRVMSAGFAPAAIGGICYPVTGFFVLWQGFPLAEVVAWFPWMLLATDRAVRRPAGFGGPALAAATAVVLWSGKVDVAGQVMLASGVYALWCAVDEYGWPPKRAVVKPLAAAAVAWTLGILLAAPYLLPLGEYLQSGGRVSERAGGSEERPPIGLAALPQMVVPDLYGSWMKDSVRITAGNRLASSAATFTGVVAALLLAPLAWCSRRHRSRNILWSMFIVLGLGWTLNVPGIVHVLRLPFFNLMSHNRFVFVAAFGILAMAVSGLAWLERRDRQHRWWFWLPPAVLGLITAWLLYHASHLPEPLATVYARYLEAGRQPFQVPDPAARDRVRETFAANYRWSAAFCGFAGLGWLLLCFRALPRRRLTAAVLGAVLAGELLSFAHGLAAQSDPELYFPEVGILEQLAETSDGRVLCFDCLPPGLNQRFRLREVRGYDGIDPARIVELLRSLETPAARAESYAPLMWLKPRGIRLQPDVRLPPILDLLGVRHLIFRGRPPSEVTPDLVADDYFVVDNPHALPRVFVPEEVRTVTDAARRLELMTAADFDPWQVAYVETEVDLPPASDASRTARIVEETPVRITVELELEAPALVVLSDLYYPGWEARLDGHPAPILRTDHALRGVVAAADSSTLVFSYRPGSLRLGALLMLVAGGGSVLWFLEARRNRRAAVP